MKQQIEQLLWELLVESHHPSILILIEGRRIKLAKESLRILYFELCNDRLTYDVKVERLWTMMKV